MEVRASLGFGVQHVVCRDLGLLDRVAPMLEGQELEPEQGMRRTGDVARGEDVVGDDAVHVEDAASSIAGDATGARAETRVAQPLGVALGAERDHGQVDLECGAVIQVGTAETLLDDSTRIAERARKAGVDVTLEIWDDMIHVFQAFAAMLPEGQQAIDKIGGYLRARWS